MGLGAIVSVALLSAISCSPCCSRTESASAVCVGVRYASAPALATPGLEYTSPRRVHSMACNRLTSTCSQYGGSSRCRAIQRGGHRLSAVWAATSHVRSGPHAKTAAKRRPFGVDGRGEFEADSTLIAVQAMAVDNFDVDVKVADQLREDQLVVWLPGPMGNDAGAKTADVYNHDCLDNWWYATSVQACSQVHSGPLLSSSR